MTRKRLDGILLQTTLYYKAFPVAVETSNHKVIIRAVELIKRIGEYRGSTRGSGALPKSLLEMRYEEMYASVQELREKVDRGERAYKEALKALDDAEDLLNYIFI